MIENKHLYAGYTGYFLHDTSLINGILNAIELRENNAKSINETLLKEFNCFNTAECIKLALEQLTEQEIITNSQTRLQISTN